MCVVFCVTIYTYNHTCKYTYMHTYVHKYIHRERERDIAIRNMCVYIFLFLTQRVFPTSSWCLLRRWTGDPPETLSGLTSNPLSLMW